MIISKQRASSACSSSHKKSQMRHIEELIEQRELAERMHSFAVQKLNEYYLLGEARLIEEEGKKSTRRKQKLMT